MSDNSQLKLVFIALLFVYTTEANSCHGLTKYTLIFRGEWTKERQADFPSNAHFSLSAGCTHNASYVMWKSGILATTGVKNVAEFGRDCSVYFESFYCNKTNTFGHFSTTDSIVNFQGFILALSKHFF